MKIYVAGLGCRRGITVNDISEAIKNSAKGKKISIIASCTIKADEYALLEYAEREKIKLLFFTPEELKNISVPSPSRKVKKYLDIESVCEAAVIKSGAKLLIPKTVHNSKVTIAIGEKILTQGELALIGIGSGSKSHLTPEAMEKIKKSQVIAGYKKYIEVLDNSILKGKKIISTGMTLETERCKEAIKCAQEGKRVSLISSGDAGIYGMAGLVLELLENLPQANFRLSFCPGITSAIIAANALGAPLMNDFAVLSLSDLLTPKKEIIKKINLLAESDLVCAVYNPQSSKRRKLLPYLIRKFIDARGKNTIFGIVKNAGRDDEFSICGTLEHFPLDFPDMNTIAFFGNSKTVLKNSRIYTKRGYWI